MQRDFYQVLGIAHDASPENIRAAYVRLVRRHHPDVLGYFPGRLYDVQQAYRQLSNPAARAAHDRDIAAGMRAHLARQHSVQRRLGRYDRRHPAPQPRPGRTIRWRRFVVATVGVAIVAVISSGLI